MRGVYNFAACALIDDIPVWVEHVMKKTMWEDPGRYWDSSPVAYAHKVKTPTLVIHSEKDHRCPISEGDQYYRALRLNGVTAELVRYAGEGHGLSRGGRPDRRVDRLQRIAAWFKRWL
jgi:dipeptidyl aminopeptidase/acylaminoacyl peptidase